MYTRDTLISIMHQTKGSGNYSFIQMDILSAWSKLAEDQHPVHWYDWGSDPAIISWIFVILSMVFCVSSHKMSNDNNSFGSFPSCMMLHRHTTHIPYLYPGKIAAKFIGPSCFVCHSQIVFWTSIFPSLCMSRTVSHHKNEKWNWH